MHYALVEGTEAHTFFDSFDSALFSLFVFRMSAATSVQISTKKAFHRMFSIEDSFHVYMSFEKSDTKETGKNLCYKTFSLEVDVAALQTDSIYFP